MKAVGYYKSLPIDDSQSLIDVDVAMPKIGAQDLLVEIKAISVNPIDYKTRLASGPFDDQPRILGFDAAGIVTELGSEVRGFKLGDAVYYAGAINRQGSNAQYQAIDHRLVALKPKTLDFAAAAAIPLTALTAFEMLFDRLRIDQGVHKGKNTFLMVGAAGGVGSMALQLARLKTDALVIATASRQQSHDWALKMGADQVIDYTKPFIEQLQKLGLNHVDFIFSTANSEGYQPQYAQIIGPQGRIGLIDGPKTFDIVPFKGKSVSLHWESMFTRSMFETSDIGRQGDILKQVAEMIDDKLLTPTATDSLSPINAENLRKAHRLMESGQHIGKLTLSDFS
ncbi:MULTISPECIES: zinc-binding alcohol dehydrogenase family protein [unclassified Bartonella]|uniref:zinc-binding alcohol dehydrogenase family protein n=1 Tax=unclassified Bartonella TaxID=2645622 RepID=UPI0021C9985D|nr:MULTISPECIES: zinc-binding alcohol dehydrogenase family protein [unclassified Bartonella]UXN03512.1 zinc-binding alcohol dehydrogenase family protein [Bartonella sp. HY406]UXN06481.1 zinc-binding alcohol dehydrogenase family protein [Bartonella sp. HY761]